MLTPAEKLALATMDEVIEDPKKFGIMTFAEYKEAHRRGRTRKSDTFGLDHIDNGSRILGKVKRQVYKYETRDGRVFEAKSLAEIQTIAQNQGVPVNSLKAIPEVREGATTELVIEVTFKEQ